MPEAQQPRVEAAAQQFVLTTVWHGLSELADQINGQTDRIATVTVDPPERGRVSLRVYPVGSQPAQAAPLFSYVVIVRSGASRPRVRFDARPGAGGTGHDGTRGAPTPHPRGYPGRGRASLPRRDSTPHRA